MVVKQRDYCSLCVYTSMVKKHITRFGNEFAGQLGLLLVAEKAVFEANGC